MSENHVNTETMLIPCLPLRDVVVFPNMFIPLFVGRDVSIESVKYAMEHDKRILLLTQRDPQVDEPKETDLYSYGTVGRILQLLKLPKQQPNAGVNLKILVEGVARAKVEHLHVVDGVYLAHATMQVNLLDNPESVAPLVRTALSLFDEYVRSSRHIPAEVFQSLQHMSDVDRLVDTMAAHLSVKLSAKQELLEKQNIAQRIESLIELLQIEIDMLKMDKRIQKEVKKNVEKEHRTFYLTKQMEAIRRELGETELGGNDNESLKEKIEKAGMSAEAKEKALSELRRLQSMSPMSPEATGLRNYLEWILSVPWKEASRINKDLCKASHVLSEAHYGLDKVKERILEYLAVQARVKKMKGPILCLVGPPGVGKTSLGRSIAEATGREYIRVALGGVRDEAEIRGHRRTYVGSMPGRIIQKMAKAKVKNPLFLLDEIDKMAMDYRGDPSSALLEVLDPEQNIHFNDHFLEVDYDLSDVLFIATANTLQIPDALLDRMEIVELPSYTEEEKFQIAKRHLLPKALEDTGLNASELVVTDAALYHLIRRYTREAGVRSLERALIKICRKVVKRILEAQPKRRKKKEKDVEKNTAVAALRLPVVLETLDDVQPYLGVPKYRYGLADTENRVGQVTGLAWTSVGGDILTIEAAALPGKGVVERTGHLGEVMQESIRAALTVLRSRAALLGIAEDFYEKKDLHIHVPEGATPKDGPSAGIGMCTAMVSALTGIPVRADIAMTGEITLRGEVLPIGGLKEKILAAKRAGITNVVIPSENEKDLADMPKNIVEGLNIHPVQWIDQVFALALERQPQPLEQGAELMDAEGKNSAVLATDAKDSFLSQ